MKKLQLILDKRQPLFIPYHFVKSFIIKKQLQKIDPPDQIYILITYDVENFWGMEKRDNQENNLNFLKKITKVKNSNSTYFVQGNLISALSKYLQWIEKKNEIGLHGHHHELWKDANFVYKKPVRDYEKEKLIKDSLFEFKKSLLRRPLSFRAPYTWCKASDMKILKHFDFIVDSSDHSQYGIYFTRNSGTILRIPVSTNPFPYYSKKHGLTYVKFRIMDLKMMNGLNNDEFYRCTDQILRLQSYKKRIPHLVFLFHSWEFYKDGEKEWGDNFNHRGERNYTILKEKLNLLEKRYSVKYITMEKFRNIFEKNTRLNSKIEALSQMEMRQ